MEKTKRCPSHGALLLGSVVVTCALLTAAATATLADPSGESPAAADLGRDDGYRGIWYMNQPQNDAYKYKYSGGFATYPQQHVPLAIYAPEVNKTFFVYGGRKADADHIVNMVSYYDHATGRVPRPTRVVARVTNDTHYNPTLTLDAQGYVYVFCNSHGAGWEQSRDDPTHGKSFVYRSEKPYSIDRFVRLRTDTFSYSQPWQVPGQGLLWLHTRYDGNRRRLFQATSRDGLNWSEPKQLVHMKQGNYQISWREGNRVATAFDYHPDEGGLNARTNLYYIETRDLGETWRTIDGKTVTTPITEVDNPALVHDYEKEKRLVYLKDLAFDASGHPVLLYITSAGPWSGPQSDPRTWHTARWTGSTWEIRDMGPADHNYDHGSLYLEADGTWRVIAPTEPGPQPGGTGGLVTVQTSRDRGATWTREAALPLRNGRNQTYVRRPLDAHPGFYAFWADGDAFEPSESDLYFATKSGRVFRLPRHMETEFAKPEAVK